MNIVIIEDELQTAWHLQNSIQVLRPDSKVVAIIDSIEAGLEWFSSNEQPDLIFSDIQLGDGLAFEMLQQLSLTCPVIFCTAYDEYALRAFQNNGIDYLLKPIKQEALKKSLDKINLFNKPLNNNNRELLNGLIKEITRTSKSYKSTFLVAYRDKMIPVNVNDIVFFRIIDDTVELSTRNSQQYRLNYSLDYIESVIDPNFFYRANRQYLIAYNAIKEVENYFDRKLLIKLTQAIAEPIIVSKAKSSDLLRWLENR
ncbi:response regulator transcription factor [Ginsengibacter hankyongi]|uniref:Response regulator transcription factor n=1 Tax=Ginsengibacter hankyongi TaxID=2607284 RepID=A0A5J5ILV4_9BACT|nr:LytTR family DNA-binding domain-containing protein [Ginsengibacter hankyongi]KAA9042096.1 response regulator transcription factor [Ginsengibacter hankyongi]